MCPPGARDRFEALYLACYPAVHRYALRRTDSADDIADVIAEPFLTAWRAAVTCGPQVTVRVAARMRAMWNMGCACPRPMCRRLDVGALDRCSQALCWFGKVEVVPAR